MRRLTVLLTLTAACGEAAPPSSPLLEVEFLPAAPVIHLGAPRDVDGTTVYDHSEFSVRITNRHPEPVRFERVNFTSIGDREQSGLGDIVDYWPWDGAGRTLAPGESIEFWKVWGFTVDTRNRRMKYRFDFLYRVGAARETTLTRAELDLVPGE